MPSLTRHERQLVSKYLRQHAPTKLPDYIPLLPQNEMHSLRHSLNFPPSLFRLLPCSPIHRDISLKE